MVEPCAIPLEGAKVEALGALFDAGAGDARDLAVLLAHGAGAPMEAEFMAHVARGLARAGFPVLRFRYPYMERAAREGRRFPPDRAPQLELAHRAALDALRARLPRHRILFAGKSMGGRIASHLAAGGVECAGLVYYGYPLHPHKQPERLRSAHFGRITAPSLFLQGTRDGLCDLELLRRELGTYAAPHELVVIDGGDHSFAVPKRSGLSDRDVRDRLVGETLSWIGRARLTGH